MSVVDLARPIETPEGSTLLLRPAGLAVRGAAWAIDMLLRLCVYILVGIPITFLGHTGVGIMGLVLFAGEWLYFAYFEAFQSGATPGKRRMGIKVVQRDGGPLSVEAALVRNLVRFVDTLPIAYGAGLVSCLLSKDFQRLGDRVAGTLVVHAVQDYSTSTLTVAERLQELAKRRARGDQEPVEELPEPQRPAAFLTGREAALILDFEARRNGLHLDRQIEIADLLEPLTGERGKDALRSLRAGALWLEQEA